MSSSLGAMRNDAHVPQRREWSLLESTLLEGEEHPLRRTASSASFVGAQSSQHRYSYPPSLSTPSLGQGLDAGAASGTTGLSGGAVHRGRGRRTSRAASGYFGPGIGGVDEQERYFPDTPTGDALPSESPSVGPTANESLIASRGTGVAYTVSEEPEQVPYNLDSAALRTALLEPDNPEQQRLLEGEDDYDSDSESDSDLSYLASRDDLAPTASKSKSRFSWLRIPTLTPLQRDILKCSIAYFIGSLFTFNPYLSKLVSDISKASVVLMDQTTNQYHSRGDDELTLFSLFFSSSVPNHAASGPSPSGHMVATGTIPIVISFVPD